MKCRAILISAIIIAGMLLATGCSSSVTETSTASETDPALSTSRAAESTPPTETATYSVDSANFPLTQQSGTLVMTGDLTSFVSVHAQVICHRDLDQPGTGSVDQAIYQKFYPKDIDLLADPAWKSTSDQTVQFKYEWGEVWDQRTVNYLLPDGRSFFMCNYFDMIYMTDTAAPVNLVPERIPWDSNTYPWGTEEFSFATQNDAISTLQNLVGRLGITLSPLYSIDYITPQVFDTACRVILAQGGNVPDKAWTDADSTYRIVATQDWNALPINSESDGFVFDGVNLNGDAFHSTGSSNIYFMLNAQGVSTLRMFNVFECKDKGSEVALVSVWDALKALQKQLNSPEQELEILYENSTKNNEKKKETPMQIDQIKLCYLPINLSTMDEETTAFSIGLTQNDKGQPTFPFEMIPCWTFRLTYLDSASSNKYLSCAVNAITGKYILMTQCLPGM